MKHLDRCREKEGLLMTIKGLKALHLQLKVDAARCSGKLYHRLEVEDAMVCVMEGFTAKH